MSQIKLLHSGGNGVSIVAPDSNPASDRTLKLPSDVNSTIDTLNRTHNVLQVVQTVLTTAVSQTSTNTDYAAISGFTRSITPSSSSNKVLVSVKIGCASASTGDGIVFRLYKDGSEVSGARGSGGSTYGHGAFIHYNKDSQLMLYGGGFDYLDSPSASNQITYQIYWASTTTGSNTRYINRRASSTGFTMLSTITLWEIAA